jgi:phage terminase small subunit
MNQSKASKILEALKPREFKFVCACWGIGYPHSHTHSQAIRIAGYTGTRANQAAYKLLQRPNVQAAMDLCQNERYKRFEREQAERYSLEDAQAQILVDSILTKVRRG